MPSARSRCGSPTGGSDGGGVGASVAIHVGNHDTLATIDSGAGIDALIAARAVGPAGRVIGVDMTPDMIGRARANARKAGVENVEFRLGEIEHLPVADAQDACGQLRFGPADQAQIMCGEDHCLAHVVELHQQVHDAFGHFPIDIARWFVGNDQVRRHDHRAGHGRALTFAARQFRWFMP